MASNTIKFTFKLNVDGKDQLVTTTASAEELQKALNSTKDSATKLRDKLILFNQAGDAFNRIGSSISSLKSSMDAFTSVYNNSGSVTNRVGSPKGAKVSITSGKRSAA